jgi:ribose 5-phosphate isomerase A
MSSSTHKEKQNAAREAVKLIKDGQVVGLGTGSTAVFAVQEIAELVRKGLRIQGVPTSDSTAALARELSIPLIDINSIDHIDITIDGADEFTKELHLIKGGGGALLREKIVAAKTRQEVIIADASKYVEKLGKFKLPVEVIPFATNYVLKEVLRLGGAGILRGGPFITDEGNYIIDVDFKRIEDPVSLAGQLKSIVGVVEHGLFTGLAERVLMGEGDSVKVFLKQNSTFTT